MGVKNRAVLSATAARLKCYQSHNFCCLFLLQVNDDELSMVLFRSQEISRYVEDGVLDGEGQKKVLWSYKCCAGLPCSRTLP